MTVCTDRSQPRRLKDKKGCVIFLTAVLLRQVLVTYGTRVVAAPPSGDPYGQRYKGIWCSLMVLTRALGGNYVNFGVFELYGDPALKVPLPVLSGCIHFT